MEVNRHTTKLVWSTTESQISSAGLHASASSIVGSCENTTNGGQPYVPAQTRSFGSKIITITATTWFKIIHLSTETANNNGFGRRLGGSNDGNPPNIYTEVSIEDLSSSVLKGQKGEQGAQGTQGGHAAQRQQGQQGPQGAARRSVRQDRPARRRYWHV